VGLDEKVAPEKALSRKCGQTICHIAWENCCVLPLCAWVVSYEGKTAQTPRGRKKKKDCQTRGSWLSATRGALKAGTKKGPKKGWGGGSIRKRRSEPQGKDALKQGRKVILFHLAKKD